MTGPAPGVAHLGDDVPRQLVLDADRELVDVGDHEVGLLNEMSRPRNVSGPASLPGWLQDALRERIGQVIERRPIAVVRADERRLHAEALRLTLIGRIQEIAAVAPPQHRLAAQLIGEPAAELDVVVVELVGRVGRAVDVHEGQATQDLSAGCRRDRIDDRWIEDVIESILRFAHRRVVVPPHPEIQCQFVGDPPIVLDPRRHEGPMKVRQHIVVDETVRASAWRSEQERGERAPRQRVSTAEVLLRKGSAEADLHRGAVDAARLHLRGAHVEAAPDVVPPSRHRDVRLQGPDLAGVLDGIPRQLHVVVHRDDRKHRRRQLADQAGWEPERVRIEADGLVRAAQLEELAVAAAQVEDGARAEDVHPVTDERVVRPDQRQLSVLRRTGTDRRRVPNLVALVLAPPREHAVVLAEVVVDLGRPSSRTRPC